MIPARSRLSAALVLLALLSASALGACRESADPIARGETRLAKGDFEGAKEAFSQAIDAGDRAAQAYAKRCLVHQELGDFEAALNDCTRALDLEPEAPFAHEVLNNRGVALIELRRYSDALDDLDAAIERKPDYLEAYANRAVALLRLDDYESALKDLTMVIDSQAASELRPDLLAEAYGNRAFVNDNKGLAEDAVRDYTRSIGIQDSAQARFNRAALWYQFGCVDEAMDDLEHVVASGEDDPNLSFMAEQRLDFFGKMSEEARAKLECGLAELAEE